MNSSFWHNPNSEYDFEEYEEEQEEDQQHQEDQDCSKYNRDQGFKRLKKKKWTVQDQMFLVRLWRQHTCLWKHSSANYLNDSSRRVAYEAIHEKLVATTGLEVSVVDVIMMIHSLRRAYVSELKKMYEAPLEGKIYKSNHVWFDELDCFLLNYLHVDELESITLAVRLFIFFFFF